MNTLKNIYILIIVLLVNTSAFATKYYVNVETGKDINNGTSIETPWKSLKKVSTKNFKPGDQILLDCPEVTNMWFNMLHNFRWPTNNPVIIIDKPGFYMDPHIDNRNILGILLINLLE